jgi:hypothetical protein
LQISRFVSAALDVILKSLESTLFGFGDVVGLGADSVADEDAGEVAGDADLVGTPLFQTNFFPDLIHVNFLP